MSLVGGPICLKHDAPFDDPYFPGAETETLLIGTNSLLAKKDGPRTLLRFA